MFKKQRLSEPVKKELEGIEVAAEVAAALATAKPDSERLDSLEQRLASLEPLMEQLAANANLGPKLAEYITDLRAEQVFFNAARKVVGIASAVLFVALMALLGLAVFHSGSPLLAAPPLAIATFVVGLVSGMVFLLNAFVKGVFRSTAERHADGFLPPALEKTVELIDKLNGKTP